MRRGRDRSRGGDCRASDRHTRRLSLRYTAPRMIPKPAPEIHAAVNPFAAGDVAAILREQKWLRRDDEAVAAWMAEAATLLGPQAENREALTHLLGLVFEYDAHAVLATRECQEVLARDGTRQVLRALAAEILNGGPVDSNRLKEIVAAVKARPALHQPRNLSSVARGAYGTRRRRRTRPRCPAA